MLNKLIKKRNIILIAYAVAFLVLGILEFIFSDKEDKIMDFIVSLVIPFIIYGLVRLMYGLSNINASSKVMRYFYYFFLITGAIMTVSIVVNAIIFFPSDYFSGVGAIGGLIVATLDKAKKTIRIEEEKEQEN